MKISVERETVKPPIKAVTITLTKEEAELLHVLAAYSTFESVLKGGARPGSTTSRGIPIPPTDHAFNVLCFALYEQIAVALR